jgi:hypothetical protein
MYSMIDAIDWRSLRSADSSIGLPRALHVLAASENRDELEKAYWGIDNESVVQGVLFESALAVTTCLLWIVGSCQANARPYILELLVQFISGAPAQSEIDLGNPFLQKRIRAEVIRFVDYFLILADTGSEEERSFCVDILGVCAIEDSALKPAVRDKLISLNGSFEQDGVNRLIENWLAEIECYP